MAAAGKRQILILSDATGDTASRVVKAALKQFVGEDVQIRRFPNLLRPSEIRTVLKEAAKRPTLIAHTFAAGPLRSVIQDECRALGIETLDLLGPLLDRLESFLHSRAQETPGLMHRIDEDYFRRIDAVEFAVMHDDGKHPEGLVHADIVLTGLSRTGKTPLSVYLALEGWRVGNVPLVHEQGIPDEVLRLPKGKVVGLVLDPRRLSDIRRSRLEYMAPGQGMDYDDELKVREEVQWCRRQFARHGIQFIDVTEKAIEESAHQVLSLMAPTKTGGAPDTGKKRLGKRA
ncbi:MAG: kinase/pyrophosphorylase [Planctomycetes bacterium]|nr:kinase/pyrophosphorylase [Planctomycetota bacterium]